MSDQTVRDLVATWINIVPRQPRLLGLEGDTTAATARGNFLGEDRSDPSAAGVAIYADAANLTTAVASILNHTQDRADFHPAKEMPNQLAAKFNDYVGEIDKTPFFHLLSNESSRESFYSKDYNLLIDQVVNLYTGVSAEDLGMIKQSISEMAKSVFGQEKAEQFKNVFSQSTIDMSDLNNPKMYLYYTSLHMLHTKNGKAEVSEQDYEVRKTEYVILPDLIKAHAQALSTLDTKSIDDWMAGASSPEKAAARLCFAVMPYRAPSRDRGLPNGRKALAATAQAPGPLPPTPAPPPATDNAEGIMTVVNIPPGGQIYNLGAIHGAMHIYNTNHPPGAVTTFNITIINRGNWNNVAILPGHTLNFDPQGNVVYLQNNGPSKLQVLYVPMAATPEEAGWIEEEAVLAR